MGPMLQGNYGAGLAGLEVHNSMSTRNVGFISLHIFAPEPGKIWKTLLSLYDIDDHLVTCSLLGFRLDRKPVTDRPSSASTSLVDLSL